MLKFKSGLAAILMTTSMLSACQTKGDNGPISEEARIQALYGMTTAPAAKNEQADITELQALLDGLASVFTIQTEAVEDETTGAVARNVIITGKDSPELAVMISELRAWGANCELSAAIAAGDTFTLAQRLDARGVSVQGMDKLSNKMVDGYMGAMGSAMSGISPDVQAELSAMDQEFTDYTATIGHIVADDLTWHALPDDARAFMQSKGEEEEDIASILAFFARMNLAFSADAISFADMRVAADFNQVVEDQMSQDASIAYTIGHFAYDDLDRGDIAFAVMDNMNMDMTMNMGAAGEETSLLMSQASHYDRFIVEDFQTTTLMQSLAIGETPDMSVRDVMNLGNWRSYGISSSLNGKPYFSADESHMDLREWSWFIPSKISMSITGGEFHTTTFVDYFTTMMNTVATIAPEDEMDAQDAQDLAAITKATQQVGETLVATDMDKIAFSFDFDGVWNPDTGAFRLDASGDVVDFMSETDSLSMILPTYADFQALAPAEGEAFDMDALGRLFADKTKLNNYSLALDDNGGIAKLFTLVHEFSKLVPAEEADESVMMLQNTPPDQLRETMQGLVRLGAMQLNSEFPPAVSWVNSFADFIQKGGKFEFSLSPSAPVGKAEIEGTEALFRDDPAVLVDLFGVSVTQIPDETEKE